MPSDTAVRADTVVRAAPGLRLRPPPNHRSPDRWHLLELAGRHESLVSPAVAAVLMAFFRAGTVADRAADAVRWHPALDVDATVRLAGSLLDRGLLVADDADGVADARETHRRWHRHGWSAALDHHLLTYDYPYLPYEDAQAKRVDIDTMERYARQTLDTDRYKAYPRTVEPVLAPDTRVALGRLTRSTRDAWQQAGPPGPPAPTAVDDVLTLLAAVFGQVRSRQPRSTVYRAPLVRKTSPSGGSRHPVEAYLFAVAISGLPSGIHHFAVRDNALERVGDLPPEAELRRIMSGPRRIRGGEPAGYLVLTGLWARNMYRYREPRTYRTVLMDAGHVAATAELVGRAVDVPVTWHHGVDDEAIHRLLGVADNGLQEGVIYGAAIGHAATG